MARRYDPERRQRIIDAAIRVVGEKGIAGLSHRSVAAEADVPLGSTTYHFKTLDDLMVAALRQANEGYARTVLARGALQDPESDLAAELAVLGSEWFAGDRTGLEVEYELYLAALGRPGPAPGRRGVGGGLRRLPRPAHGSGDRARPGRPDRRDLPPGAADGGAVRRGVRAGGAGAGDRLRGRGITWDAEGRGAGARRGGDGRGAAAPAWRRWEGAPQPRMPGS
jgi:AcrR family transcriptional regulator